MKLFKSGIKIQKKYIGFFTVVPLLLLTAIIKVPCPVCNGTGEISNTGMSNVSVVSIQDTLQSEVSFDNCLSYRVYTYNVVLTLKNTSLDVNAMGYVELGIVDNTTFKLLGVQSEVAVVPASQQVQNFFTVTYWLASELPASTSMVANIDLSNSPCVVCDGTGKVSLNQWLLAKLHKTQITQTQLIYATPLDVSTPPDVDTPEVLIGQEFSTDNWAEDNPALFVQWAIANPDLYQQWLVENPDSPLIQLVSAATS